MYRVWVKTSNNDDYRYDDYRYKENKTKWELGTVVGEVNTAFYGDSPRLQDIMVNKSGVESLRLLVELENGDTVEAWSWETYKPVDSAQSKNKKKG